MSKRFIAKNTQNGKCARSGSLKTDKFAIIPITLNTRCAAYHAAQPHD
ncbi:hypothetical protein [Alysiella crassa]|nr:hypothetical protein [Alysiella crassa]UOP07013.1 hypothetical protein LVJ80_00515 [Alysiella crassa]